MTRPEIIRADTIDLQAHARDNPSAQRHQRPTADGSLAPHQAETLREVAAEAAEEILRSPRGPGSRNGASTDSTISEATTLVADGTNSMSAGTRQDALAIAQNGGLSGQEMDDGDMDGETEVDLDDDMMDKISSSPSIEDEDIDFEFVYALHTFVATVEGQANATKGDTMVLLDDSNSYWWLVRVVKDSSIGYLPAEHIETPTERLARLNKHRNIDLAATMLGDQADRPKGNIMAAMKRKKKTVQFAPPTFVDYSEIDYSSEEEDAQAGYPQQQQQQQQQAKQSQQADIDSETEDESAKVEPLKPKLAQKDGKADGRKQEDVERSRSSEELLEARSGDGPKKTSDGTVRDSFFKDDTVETKKITLTPNLLRDDDAPRTSSDSKELKQRISFDKLDKEANLGKDDKRKRDKKEKDKKPSAIRNFFSRNHKRKGDEDDDSLGRRDSQDRDGPEEEEPQPTTPERAPAPQRQPSKLQKQMPRTEPSPTRKPNIAGSREAGGGMDIKSFLTETKVNNVANVPPASMRLVEASPDSSPQNHRRAQNGDVRPQKTKQVMSRMDLDDFDTSDEEEVMMSPEPELQQNTAPVVVQQVRQQQPQQQRPYQNPAPNPAGDMYNHNNVQQQPRAAGPAPQQQQQPQVSPEVSPINTNNPPGLIVDTSSSQEEENPQSPSPRSTPSPTELLNQRDEDGEDADTSGIKDSVATTVSSPRNSWNDSNLRAFFDSGSDIRDLLVVVYDKSNLDPVDVSSHPVAGSLFREQNAKLAEITTQLDNMLGDWLARKQRLRGSV